MQQQHQMQMGNVQQQAHPEFYGQPGGGPPMNTLPPPGLVIPPHLGATTAGPPSTQAGPNASFDGFFNAAAGQPQQMPPHQMGYGHATNGHPTATTNFPTTPATSPTRTPFSASAFAVGSINHWARAMGTGPMLQQNTPIKSEPFDQTMPTSTDHSAVKEEQSNMGGGGGFNINQMLEQITRQQSPTPASSNMNTSSNSAFGNQTLDLFASVGLGLGANEGTGFGGIAEESPASPTISADQQQADAEKPVALHPKWSGNGSSFPWTFPSTWDPT